MAGSRTLARHDAVGGPFLRGTASLDGDAGSGVGGDPDVEMGRGSDSDGDTFGGRNVRAKLLTPIVLPPYVVVDLRRDQGLVGAERCRNGWLLLVAQLGRPTYVSQNGSQKTCDLKGRVPTLCEAF